MRLLLFKLGAPSLAETERCSIVELISDNAAVFCARSEAETEVSELELVVPVVVLEEVDAVTMV